MVLDHPVRGLQLLVAMQSAVPKATSRAITVLLVDDDEALLELTALLLARRGFEVCAATDVRSAFHLLATDSPDIVITDLLMPGFDGFDLRRSLQLAGVSLPVLALSGATDPRTIARARGAGFRRVLTKPCDPAGLTAAVYEALAEQQRAQQLPD